MSWKALLEMLLNALKPKDEKSKYEFFLSNIPKGTWLT